jgi:hypothetical protein
MRVWRDTIIISIKLKMERERGQQVEQGAGHPIYGRIALLLLRGW